MFDRQWIFPADLVEGADVVSILKNRGIDNIEDFIEGDSRDFDNPFEITGIDILIERVLSAQDNGEKITIFGDYDCDGITSTTILYHFLNDVLEANVSYYIPNRFTEGYGMSVGAVDKICEQGTELIITVDNGITAADAIKRATDLGIDVIVTDHHQCPPNLPVCDCIIDPHMEGSGFHYKDLCGAGVIFVVIAAIADTLGIDRSELDRYFPIVAIGTVGDCVPLTGLNRYFVRKGFKSLEENAEIWPGLKCLMDKSDLSSVKSITSIDISFKIVPKLNAAGRLGSADRAVELLLENDIQASAKCAAVLIEENNKRRETEQSIYEEAVSDCKIFSSDSDCCVISIGEDWHHGVIGIVASRLCEKYNKPSFVFTFDRMEGEDEIYKGSCRSVKGFNIYKAIASASEHVVQFGGHEMAAGLSVKKSCMGDFLAALNRYNDDIKANGAPPPQLVIDGVLKPDQITVPFIKSLNMLEPFGEGNTQPVFATFGLRVIKTSRVGDKGKHLRVLFSYDGGTIEGMMFGSGKLEETVSHIKSASIAYTLSLDTWNNVTKPSLTITDIHDFDLSVEKVFECCYNKGYISYESFGLCRNYLVGIYKMIMRFNEHFTFSDLAKGKDLLVSGNIPCSWFNLRKAIEIFTELGIVTRLSKTEFIVNKNAGKADLLNSAVYKSVMF